MSNNNTQSNVESGFLTMLKNKTGGVTLPALDSELAAVVRQVQDTGKKGTLIYKITVSRNARRGVKIVDDLSVKLPKDEPGESFFYADDNGLLCRNDPNQPELPGIRDAGAEKAPVRDI